MAALTVVSEAPLYPPWVDPPAEQLSLAGFIANFIRNPLTSLPAEVYQSRFTRAAWGPDRMVWLTDPALIGRVLLNDSAHFPKTPLDRRILGPILGEGILISEGESWRWQRKIAAPMFRHGELLDYVPTFVTAAQDQIARWTKHPAGSLLPIEDAMSETTFSVINSTIFAGSEGTEGDTIRRTGKTFLAPITWDIAFGILRLPGWTWFPGKWKQRRAAREQRAAVGQLVARRRALPFSDDILGRLLAARRPETGEAMSDEQLVDNLATFLTAGHETTAKALTWTLYLLARSPQWQQRLRDEVRAVCGSAPVEARHVEQLRLTAQVIKESMRLYPPVPVMTRLSAADGTYDDLKLKAGQIIVVPIYALHRHAMLWSEPHRFDPERFAPEREAKLARCQYMPFGFGQRICIGAAFAMLEATAILATLVRAARFEWDGKFVPKPVSRVTLRPEGGMPLKVTVL